MKRITCAVLAIMLICLNLLCGCGDKKSDSKKKDEAKKETVQTVTVELDDERAAEGFFWKAETDSSNKFFTVEEKEKKDGKTYFTVTPKKQGSANVDFLYRKPDDVDVSLVAKYTFTVDKDLKLKETSHSGTYFFRE